MYQDPQIIARKSELGANLVFIALFQQHGLKQTAVALRQIVQDFANHPLRLVDLEHSRCADSFIDELVLRLLVDARVRPAMGAIVFEQYVVAHRIDERPEPFGLAYPVLCVNQCQYSYEGFLPDVIHPFLGTQAPTQFEPDEFTEVGGEMTFGARIAALQAFEVSRVERDELQAGSLPWRGRICPL